NEMASFIAELSSQSAQENLSEITKNTLLECKKEYERNSKVPQNDYTEYVILQSKAEAVWEKAKAQSDYAMFEPYLEKLVATTKKCIGCWGFEGNRYNTLLDMYEAGVTVKVLDEVFGRLRQKIVALVQGISESNFKFDTSF